MTNMSLKRFRIPITPKTRFSRYTDLHSLRVHSTNSKTTLFAESIPNKLMQKNIFSL